MMCVTNTSHRKQRNEITASLSTPRIGEWTPPRLRIVEGADHSFHVLKRSGRDEDEVMAELADATADFSTEVST